MIISRQIRTLIVVASVAQACPVLSAASYRFVELQGLPGATRSEAWAINEAGHACGESNTIGESGYGHAVKWIGGSAIDIIGSGLSPSQAFDINDSGIVVGTTDEFSANGFIESGGEVTMLPPLILFGGATAIGNDGAIVGNSIAIMPPGAIRAVRWVSGRPLDLGAMDGVSSTANDINEQGVICGGSGHPAEPRAIAVIWLRGEIVPVADYGGVHAAAHSINAHGEVVGQAWLPQGPPTFSAVRAFHWNGAETSDLGTLGGTMAWATSINDHGDIVGYSTTTTGPTAELHAVIWIDGKPRNLNAMVTGLPNGGVLTVARDINNARQIVGQFEIGTHTGAFRLDPLAPEDLDGDDDVDGFDLALLLGAWGRCPTKADCPADLDGNGIVDGFDLALLLGAWE